MLSVNLQDVEPFLAKTLTAGQTQLVNNWILVLAEILNTRYGEKITPENNTVFTFFIGQAIKRMLENPQQTVISQSMENASVTYAAHSTKGDLFLPAELSQMDALTGKRSTKLVRAISPKILNH